MVLKMADLIEESVTLELNVGELYLLFSRLFPEHREFWWHLCLEENNHAALLRSYRDHFAKIEDFPDSMLADQVDEVQEVNRKIVSMIKRFEAEPPTAETAFRTALELEESAGEIHFERAVGKEADNVYLKVFQQLNQDDKHHADRLLAKMREIGIEPTASGEAV